MTGQVTHLHIATTTGLAHWAILAHAGAGMIGLVTGFLALAVRKGSRIHKVAGQMFVYAMITMGIMATAIGAYEGRPDVLGGMFTAYLVFTAMTTVRPIDIERRGLGVALALFALVFGVGTIRIGFDAMNTPGGVINGTPFGMFFFLGTIGLLAGLGDLRVAYAGATKGTARIARHLWRMCFGLFVASGSFFLGQMRFFPKPLRVPGLLILPAVLPLVALLYWLWRVRVRQSLRGMITAVPTPTRAAEH
ncbi:MAG TPA: hypothetical protein VIV65_12025 [Gemmatimonadaceae bacterium]